MQTNGTSYRGHTTRWQVVVTVGLILFCAALAVFQGYFIYEGITTGAIKSLSRRSRALVYLTKDPGWFGFNIVVRVGVTMLAASATLLFWRLRLRNELSDL